MARPIKNYCDYFSHDRDMRNHRKVKAIRTKFKVNGYGIWCMILEYLTGTDGNVFEFSEVELELMSGDFGVTVTEIRDVIDYCIKLELLFINNGFVNSESLDERLRPVYEKRHVAKSKSKQQDRVNGKFSHNKTDPIGVSVTEMPQSKVKESKVKEIKEETRPDGLQVVFKKKDDMPTKNETIAPMPFQEPEFELKWKEWLEYRKQRKLPQYVPIGLKGTFTKLKKISLNDVQTAISIIQQSMDDNYQGLFPLKQNFNGKTNQREPSAVGRTIEFDRP